MATHKSAAKRARQTVKRTTRNKNHRTRMKGEIRAFHEALASADQTDTSAKLKAATRTVRKAASKGVLHKRAASRYVSRLARAAAKSKS